VGRRNPGLVGSFAKTMWITGEAAKGYLMEDLEEAFKRYIPRFE